MSHLEAALAYASGLGWSVFPIAPDTKRPATMHGFRDASTDEQQLRTWWEAEPTFWIGVWCRASGFIAIDVDPRNGGTDTLTRLELKYGPLPRSLVQQSGSGGLHILLADPSPGVNGWTRNAADGGEIRGKLDALGLGRGCDVKANGYILTEPSGAYKWLTDLGPAPSVPERWLEALRKPAPEPGNAPDADGLEAWAVSSDAAPLPQTDRERLRADLRALGPRGSGKSTTFSAVLRIFHDYGLSLEDGYPLLVEWNETCGMPRPEHELHRQMQNIADSGRAQGMRGNRRSDLRPTERIARAAVDRHAISEVTDGNEPEPPTRSRPDISSLIASIIPAVVPATAIEAPVILPPAPVEVAASSPHQQRFSDLLEESAAAILERTTPAGDEAAARAITPMFEPANVLLKRAFPPMPWLVDELLTENCVAGLAGEPKSTKTFCATELAISIASGTPAFGKFATGRPKRVAYLYAEDGGPSVQRRIVALATSHTRMAEGWESRLHVQPRGRTVDLTKDLDVAVVVASCRMFEPIDLLILDPLRDLHSGKEDSSDDMRPVIERMRIIGDILHCGVLFTHHSAKATADNTKRRPGQRMRGSSAIHGAVDCGIYLWDLRGDGKNEFINAITSEVRAGRSAGTFDLTLKIIDNKYGVSERAAWSIGEREVAVSKELKTEATMADVLTTMLSHGAPITEIVLHRKLGGGKQIIAACLAGGKREGLVEQRFAGTTFVGWALTEKGTATIRSGSSGVVRTAAAPHPATAAICDVPEVRS